MKDLSSSYHRVFYRYVNLPQVSARCLLLSSFLIACFSMQAQNVSFTDSGLSGESLNNPTSLQFGPDGRLYVSQQNGNIYAYNVVRNGPNDYDVVNTELIDLIQQITNHNDDGSSSGVNTRQVTGIYLTGTGANPILYVSSSDSRIGAGGGGGDTNLDTNSGVISKLTCSGLDSDGQCISWTKIDLVRGLPRSEENHSTNGMQLDEQNNILYVAQGGNTNAGAPSNNFAFTTEYALAAAVLQVDLDLIENLPTKTDSEGQVYKYNLPTPQNVTKLELLGSDNDHPDPWGGDDGLNQAMVDPNGPVTLYATGFRNLYDIKITQDGRMYGVDNGANGGWGGFPEYEESFNATNNFINGEPGSNSSGPDPSNYPSGITLLDGTNGTVASDGQPDAQVNNKNGLHNITPGYYGGHPTPIRGNPDGAGLWYNGTFYEPGNPNLPASWPPVTVANPIECDFQNSGVDDGTIANFGPSTNGITEYTASNFNGALNGVLLLAALNGNIYQVELDGTGNVATNCPANPLNNCNDSFASGFGASPLDVIAQGDNDPFGGTVWAVTYGANNVTIFEPADYNGNDPGVCNGNDDDTIDEDGDSYTNADEIDNGTNPCSAASQPEDFDDVIEFNGFKRSDLNDEDDDNDGILDVDDAFCFDAANGFSGIGDLPIRLELFGSTGYGFGSLGFTGIMTNGSDDYFTLIDDAGDELVFGGTSGIYTDPSVAEGDAFTNSNSQKNAFQFPINVSTTTGPFTVEGQINGPYFSNSNPLNFASQGIFIGTGDQDNYLKVTIRNNNGTPAIQILFESGGVQTADQLINVPNILSAIAITFYISIDPVTGEAQVSYQPDGGTRTDVGIPVSLSGSLLNAIQGNYSINGQNSTLAAGPIATSTGAAPEFIASWDYFQVSQNPSKATAEVAVNTNGINGSTFGNSSFNISNTANGSNIAKVIFDLSTAIIPELVFDPSGTAGDNTAKDLTLDGGSDNGTGYFNHTFSQAYEGGFYQLEVDFSDFNPGESIAFGLDIDPVSIKGGSSPGPNEAGSVSGLELAGSKVTVLFNTGESWTVELFSDAANGLGNSNNTVRNAIPDAPTILMNNISTQSVAFTPNQAITVTGPVGGTVKLLQLEAGLFVEDLDGPNAGVGYAIDPWEVNSVIDVKEFTNIIGNSFTADFNVILTDSDPEAGYNIFAAVVVDSDGTTSDLSNFIIVEFDPDAAPVEEIRINAGGTQYTDGNGNVWEADQYFVNGAVFPSGGPSSTAIANTTDDFLYQTERFNANLQYEIPVTSTGPFEVNLHFAELYFGLPGGGSSGGDGSRVFDVVVEGNVEIVDYDIHEEVGPATAVIKTYTNVNVTDGVLNLAFPAFSNNGKISAIEVKSFGSSDIPITVAPITDQVNLEGTQSQFDVAAFGGQGNLSYIAVGLPPGLNLEPTNGDIFGSINTGAAVGGPNSDGIYPVSITVDDSDGTNADAVTISFNWTVVEQSTQQVLYRVNAGGPLIVASDAPNPDWTLDQGQFGTANNSPYLIANSTGVSIFTTNSNNAYPGPIDITSPSLNGTNVPAGVFNTERYDATSTPEMQWAFPIPVAGPIEVRLYFAEIFSEIIAAGQRVFDVEVEGVVPTVFSGIDPFAQNGAASGFMLSHVVNVTDGTLNLEFIHATENPSIKAIEIISLPTSGNLPPVVNNPGTQNNLEGDIVNLQIVASDTDPCTGLSYSAAGLPPSLNIDQNTGLITGILEEGSGMGTAGAFQEDNGLIIFEAEKDFVETPGGWNLTTEGSTDFLVASSNHFGNTNGQTISYNLEVTNPGVYRLHMKSDFTGDDPTEENDSWFKVQNTSDVHFFCVQGGNLQGTAEFVGILNGNPSSKTIYYPAGNGIPGRTSFSGSNPGNSGFFKFFRSGGGNNKWDGQTIDFNGFPVYAYFPNAGTYTLQLSERSLGHKVDRIAMTNIDLVGTGEPTTLFENSPDSQQNIGGMPGASAGSPYNVVVTVSDGCSPAANNIINFQWTVTQAQNGTPSALVQVGPGTGLTASTFTAGSFQITNTGDVDITFVDFNLTSGFLPDVVWDPVGTAGDSGAKCLEVGSEGGTGYIFPNDNCVDPFSQFHNSIDTDEGYDIATVTFTDFNSGETFSFASDNDPTSIKNDITTGDAGSISGFELIGSTVTVGFANGTTLVGNLFDEGSLGGSQVVLAEAAPTPPPFLTAQGITAPAVVADPNQTILIQGNPNATITVLRVDARLYIDAGGGGFDIDPFEANTAMAKELYTVSLDANGDGSLPVTLTQTTSTDAGPDGGINHFIAVEQGALANQTSQTSNVIILEYDPTAVSADLTITVSNEGRDLGAGTPDYSGDYTVDFYDPSDLMTPVATYTTTADASGSMTINGLSTGTYQVAIKRPGFLQLVQTITMTTGANTMSFGTMLAGDVNGDNEIGLEDISLLGGVFNTTNVNTGTPGFYADFNGDGTVGLEDISLLGGNFNTNGENPTP